MNDKKVNPLKIFKGFIWFFFSKMFPALSGLLIFSLTSRGISAAELGTITLSASIVSFLVFMSFNGYGDALIQIKTIDSKHIGTVTSLTLLSSCVLYAISVIFIKIAILYNVLSQDVFIIYLILGFKCIMDALAIVPVSLMTRDMDFKSLAIRTLYTSIIATLICIPVFFYFGGVVALLVNYLSVSLLGLLIAWRTLRAWPKLTFDKASFNELSPVGGSTTAAKVITSVNFDNIIIGFLATASTLGFFSFSKRIFGIFTDILSGSISSISYPVYSRLQSNNESLKQSFLTTTFLSSAIGVPCYVGLILLAPFLIPLVFGEHWGEAIPVLQISCLLGLITCIGTLQVSLIKGLGKAKWVLYYQIIQQALTILICVFFSGYGAFVLMALITIKTYVVWPVTALYICNLLKMNLLQYFKNISSSVLAGFLMASSSILLMPLSKNLNIYIFMSLLIVTCAIVYVATLYLLERKRINFLISFLKK